MKMIRIKEIAFNSSDYKKAVTIREEILRIPLGLSFSKEELEEEASKEIEEVSKELEEVSKELEEVPVSK